MSVSKEESLAERLYRQSREAQLREDEADYKSLLSNIKEAASKVGSKMQAVVPGTFKSHLLERARQETKLNIVETHEPPISCPCDSGCSRCMKVWDYITVSWASSAPAV